MISFNIGQVRFNYRVAGACIHEGHILLHKAVQDHFWSLPGGRVETMESSAADLSREMGEELPAHGGIQIERLLWVVENFFTSNRVPHHELGFYYLIAFSGNPDFYNKQQPFSGIEDTGIFQDEALRLIFKWFPLGALDDILLYPTFLKTSLRNLPTSVQHIVHIAPDD